MFPHNDEKLEQPLNLLTLSYLNPKLNSTIKKAKDEISYGKKVLLTLVIAWSINLIQRIIMLILSVVQKNNSYTGSFQQEILFSGIAVGAGIAELLVNVISKCKEFRGIPTQIMCNILIFIQSYSFYHKYDQVNIIIDFSYVTYVLASIFCGLSFQEISSLSKYVTSAYLDSP